MPNRLGSTTPHGAREHVSALEIMAMPIIKGLDLPIKFVPFSGPAVDALDQRKENNDHPRVTAEELRASFNKVKTSLFSGFGVLLGK
jgi:hypothetical protein